MHCTVVRGGANHCHMHGATCIENFMKFGHVVSEIREQIDRQTYTRHGHRMIAVFRTAQGAKY